MEVLTKDSGRTVKDMVWEWKRVTGGCTVASGHKVTKDDMACDRARSVTPSMRAPGPTDFKMVTDQKLTPMVVSVISLFLLLLAKGI